MALYRASQKTERVANGHRLAKKARIATFVKAIECHAQRVKPFADVPFTPIITEGCRHVPHSEKTWQLFSISGRDVHRAASGYIKRGAFPYPSLPPAWLKVRPSRAPNKLDSKLEVRHTWRTELLRLNIIRQAPSGH